MLFLQETNWETPYPSYYGKEVPLLKSVLSDKNRVLYKINSLLYFSIYIKTDEWNEAL